MFVSRTGVSEASRKSAGKSQVLMKAVLKTIPVNEIEIPNFTRVSVPEGHPIKIPEGL